MKLILLTLLAVISTSALADEFVVEEENLISPPALVQEAIKQDSSFAGYKKCALIGKTFNITGQNQNSGFVATTAKACGFGAALGPIWVVYLQNNQANLVLSSGGYSLQSNTSKQKSNLLNLKIIFGTASEQSETIYQFNGKKYVPINK